MKKRLFPLLLALMLCLGLTVPALATNSDFTIENGVLKKYNGSGGSVTIPNGVTAIGDYAFERCNTVTSVILPNSLTSIGSSAFARCTNLTSINIPNSVTYIGSLAFEWCPNLTNMVIPDSVTSVGDFAFNMCSKLSTVTLPDGLKSIGKNSFSFTNLASVDLPDSVEFIGESAFQNTGITHIKIPSMAVIVSAGEARDFCKEALQCARQGNFEEAEAKLKEAKDSITEAHNGQTEVIQAEMRGEETKISLLFIHAQDTIMTITSEINMATEMLEMYKLIHGKGGRA